MTVSRPPVEHADPPVLLPMLAGASGMPKDNHKWLFETKWDGVRAVARVAGGRVQLTSRLGNDVTAGYPELQALGAAMGGHAAVLDGEIVAFDHRGRPSFEQLQQRMHVRSPTAALLGAVPVLYVIFDLLWLDGQLLIDEPFEQRRHRLEGLELNGPSWVVSKLLDTAPDEATLAACREIGLEGYMAKLARSPYLPGVRTKSWSKVKCSRQREFVVGGWSEGSGSRSGQVGSLAIGWVDPDAEAPPGHSFALRYAGLVGSGLTEDMIRRLGAQFRESAVAEGPFVPAPPRQAGVRFVRPELVVEVQFTEMTRVGVLRQPSLKGFRNDVPPGEVLWSDELA